MKKPAGETSSYAGCLDGVFPIGGSGEGLHGWAFNRAAPSERVELDLVVNGKAWHRVTAALPREDLRSSGHGDGAHSFQVPLSTLALPGGESIRYVNAYVVADRRELPGSPWVAPSASPSGPIANYRVDPMNARSALKHLAGRPVDYLLVDTNNLCNADCVYCSHTRGPELLELETFKELLKTAGPVKLFQLGCGQEPTADSRMGEFLRLAHEAPVRPGRIQLITNGTLLDRHDAGAYTGCRLDSLMLSIDTMDHALNARLRQGTDLQRMLRNLDWFRGICPWARIHFSIVVSAETIDGVRDLVEYGKSIRVAGYFFREVTSYMAVEDRPRRADFEDWMAKLKLPPSRFERLAEEIKGMGIAGKYSLLPAVSLQEKQSRLKYEARLS